MFFTASPVFLSTIPDNDWEDYARTLIQTYHSIGAEQIFLCPDPERDIARQCGKIKALAPIFQKDGLKVGVWFTVLFSTKKNTEGYQEWINLAGEIVSGRRCPSDQRFANAICNVIAQFADTGVDCVMLDDDFRMNINQLKPCCFCKNHISYIESLLGEPVDLKTLQENMFTGKPNRYRDAWMDANMHFLEELSWKIRKTVDKKSKHVPVWLASGPALWTCDGADPTKLARILAGDNPFVMRLAGGPYWPGFFPKVKQANYIDISRNEASYCKRNNIVCMAEGDTYPRPRYSCAASQLELFEIAHRADGNADGILKYVFDYVSCVSYEQGYINETIKNQELYAKVEHVFGCRKPSGVSVFVPINHLRYRNCEKQDQYMDVETECLCSPSIKILNDNSIPSHFEQYGPVLVFGGDASLIDLDRLRDGAIIDLPAAKILQQRGVDVGIEKNLGVFEEDANDTYLTHIDPYLFHRSYEEYSALTKTNIHELALKSSATIVSYYSHGKNVCPGEYLYENELGYKFMVFPFDAQKEMETFGMFRNYYRQQQLVEAYKWIAGRPLDAVCLGHPDLYMMVKSDADSVVVGLWNFSLDPIDAPKVILSEEYTILETIGCEGKLDGDSVILSRLGAQEFCCFVAKNKKE